MFKFSGLTIDLSKPRIHENGKKSCLLHSTATSHCGCPDSTSQLDASLVTTTVTFTQEELDHLTFPPVSEPGTYLLHREYARRGNEIRVTTSYEKRYDR